jgi:hypothetical protein
MLEIPHSFFGLIQTYLRMDSQKIKITFQQELKILEKFYKMDSL